jgi:hypothetical protein
MEPREKKYPINRNGKKLLLKIRKGQYWRSGPPAQYPIFEELWDSKDIGDLIITSKRLIFVGINGNHSLRLNQILDFNVFRNGIAIKRENGSNLFFESIKNTDVFGMILGRAIKDSF